MSAKIEFQTTTEGTSILELHQNGDIFVKGERVTRNIQVVEALTFFVNKTEIGFVYKKAHERGLVLGFKIGAVLSASFCLAIAAFTI